MDRCGQTHAHADHLIARDLGLLERLRHERRGGVQALLRLVVDVEVDVALGEDRRGEVADRDAQAAVPERDADGGAGRGVERQQDRRPAALCSACGAVLGALDDEAVGLQVGDQARHRRAR
jgi:hypothetical protein